MKYSFHFAAQNPKAMHAAFWVSLCTHWRLACAFQQGPALPAQTRHCADSVLWFVACPCAPHASTSTSALRRVGPFSGAILAALVYELAFRPDHDGMLRHRGPGVGLFPGMAGVEGEEKTGAAGDVLPSNSLNPGIAEGGGFQAGGNREAQDKYSA